VKKDNQDHLGRKILDLIKENEIDINDNEEIIEVSLEKIKPNPAQPRKYFNEKALEELAASIKNHGVIQPIILQPDEKGYVIIAGERRVKASKLAGKSTIPSVVRHYNSLHLQELSILENLQREELTVIEEAMAYSHILEKFNISHNHLAKRLGKSRSYVTNIIGLLKLPSYVIEELYSGNISMGHARILSKINNDKLVHRLLNNTIQNKLNVRELEKLVRDYKNSNGEQKNNKSELSQTNIKKIFENSIDVKVNKNSLIIKYNNEEDMLNSIKKIGLNSKVKND